MSNVVNEANPLPKSSTFRIADVFATAASGLGSRPLRTVLSALGITIGIGAMVAVLGLSPVSYTHLTLPTIYSV